MSLLITFILFLIFAFRRRLFKRFVGETGILAFETLILTVFAAFWFTRDFLPFFCYFMGTVSLLMAFVDGKLLLGLIGSKNDNNTNS